VQTPYGTFALKFFFQQPAGITGSGDQPPKTRLHIEEAIKKVISKEPQDSPYSDEEIAAKLKKEENITITRRMVAKHRQKMGIPPARLRKRYL
jgi:RNA polymerase sigma-54 factor